MANSPGAPAYRDHRRLRQLSLTARVLLPVFALTPSEVACVFGAQLEGALARLERGVAAGEAVITALLPAIDRQAGAHVKAAVATL